MAGLSRSPKHVEVHAGEKRDLEVEMEILRCEHAICNQKLFVTSKTISKLRYLQNEGDGDIAVFFIQNFLVNNSEAPIQGFSWNVEAGPVLSPSYFFA